MLRKLLLLVVLAPPFATAKQIAFPICSVEHFQDVNYQVCESINEAAKLTDHDNSEDALAILKDLPADSTVSPELAALVRSERLRAQRAAVLQAKRKSSAFATFWDSLASKASTLFEWLVLLALAAFCLFGLAQLTRLKRVHPQTLISFTDQSAENPSEVANLILTQEANRLLNPTQEPASDELVQEASISGGGATFVNMQPILGTSSIETALGTADSVSLGAVKISPKALIQAWKDALRPRYRRTLQGIHSKTGDTTFVYVQMLDDARKPIKGAAWSASRQGADARDAALREVMAKVMIIYSNAEQSTRIWQSLDCFQQAMDLYRHDKSLASISASQLLLQKSLKYDPSNWMARYNNALFLQPIGNLDDSLQNWSFLHESLLNGKVIGPQTSGEQLAKLKARVDYNRALTLARMEKWEELKEAIDILEGVLVNTSEDLNWLTKSALASALRTHYKLLVDSSKNSSEVKARPQSTRGSHSPEDTSQDVLGQESGKPNPKSPRKVSVLEKTFARIEHITAELIESLKTSQPISASLMHATAIARGARGAVLLDFGVSPSNALDDFNAAILLSPDLIDPRLNAAKAVVIRKKEGWTVRAESLLKSALQLDPNHREVHFLLGSLYLDQAVFRLSDAAENLKLADPHSWASFKLGELYLTPSFGVPDPKEALKQFRKSVRLGDAVDIRAQKLVRHILSLVGPLLAAKDVAPAQSAKLPEPPAFASWELLEMSREAERIAKRIQKRLGGPEKCPKAAALEKRAHHFVLALEGHTRPPDSEIPPEPKPE